VHRIGSLVKRWLLGTHQRSVDQAHLQSYLNEFAFRFNRRRSTSRGMLFYRVLELAVRHDPVRYRDLVVDRQPKATRPVPPVTGGHPPSLDRPKQHARGTPPTATVRSAEYPQFRLWDGLGRSVEEGCRPHL
jgi:hypothetical protein